MSATTRCPCCGSNHCELFIERRDVPVHQNLVVATRSNARAVTRGNLEMCCCSHCGFVFNRAFDAALVQYGDSYDNTQSYSPAFSAYMDELVARIASEDVRELRIVEVGCGKGHFLRRLVAALPGSRGWGFDPSYVGPDVVDDGRTRFVRELYGAANCLDADIVVTRHVIEHVADPIGFLNNIRAALTERSRPRIFIETPSVGWILENMVMWDFFYEHCSLFAPSSIRTALHRCGFRVRATTATFGDQYMWTEATVADTSDVEIDAGTLPALARSFAAQESEWIERWQRSISGSTRTAIWGAGAKGTTLANLVDPDATRLDCIVDLNPQKQGRFAPGTGHPIIAPSELGTRGVTRALLMNPNYRDEIERLVKELGLHIELVTERA